MSTHSGRRQENGVIYSTTFELPDGESVVFTQRGQGGAVTYVARLVVDQNGTWTSRDGTLITDTDAMRVLREIQVPATNLLTIYMWDDDTNAARTAGAVGTLDAEALGRLIKIYRS